MKKRQVTRRILSFILAFVMVLGYVGVSVSYATSNLETKDIVEAKEKITNKAIEIKEEDSKKGIQKEKPTEEEKPIVDDEEKNTKENQQEEKLAKKETKPAEEKPEVSEKSTEKEKPIEKPIVEEENPTEEAEPEEIKPEKKHIEEIPPAKEKEDKSHYPQDWEHFPFDYEKFLKDLNNGIISGNYDEVTPSDITDVRASLGRFNLMSLARSTSSRRSGTRWVRIPGIYSGTRSYFKPAGYLYQNGNLVFCIEQGVDISTGFNGYSTTNLSSYFGRNTAKKLALIAHFGYYSQRSGRNYAFTQRFLWEVIHPSRSFMSGTSYANKTNLNSSYHSWKRNVINKINAFNTLPSFNGQTRTLDQGQTVTFTDSRHGGQVLNYSKAINTPSGVKVTTTGSRLSITIDERVTKPFTLSFQKLPKGWSNRRKLDLVYKARGVQNLSTVPIPAKFDPAKFRVTINPVVKGSLNLIKRDAETRRLLEGASFEVRNSKGQLLRFTGSQNTFYTPTTSSKGQTSVWVGRGEGNKGILRLRNLPLDTYTIKEVSAPLGHALYKESFKVALNSDEAKTVEVKNEKTRVLIYKYDGKTKKVLANTEFILKDKNGKLVPIKPSGTFNTPNHKYVYDENPPAKPRHNMFVKNDGYLVIEGLPVGTYRLIESKPLEGYRKINDRYFTVSANNDSKHPVKRVVANYLDTGALSVAKIDSRTKKYLGGAHIELWKDGDSNQKVNMLLRPDQDPAAEEKFYDYSENKGQSFIYTSDNGFATIENLPQGRYRLVESKKPSDQYEDPNDDLAGRTPSDKLPESSPYWINVTEKKKSVNFILLNHKKNPVVRVSKVDEKGSPVAGAILNILEDNGEEGERLVEEFTSKDTFHEVKNLKRGQKYILREIKAPDGRLVAKDIAFEISEDDMTKTLTMVDYPVPEITTFFSLNDGKSQVTHPNEVKLVDKVEIDKLIKGNSYKLVTSIYEKDSKDKITLEDGSPLELVKEFKALDSNYYTMVELDLDLSKYAGKKLVASQKLYSEDELIASHEDLENEKQTIEVRQPEIKTNFTDRKGEKEVFNKGKVTLVDKVSYKDLIVGKEYKLSLTVMDKSTNKPLLENGNPITVDHKFIAQSRDGIEEVEITLDLSHFKTKKIVAFEKLIYEGKEIAVHEDIEDEGQTIIIKEPGIKTSFTDRKGEKEIFNKGKVTLVDKVSYKDLIVGKEYKLSLTVMDKSTNKPLLENGKPVTVDHKFIAQSRDGIEKVEITLDLSHFKAKKIVAFEKLIYEGKEIAVHEDIEDEGQTIIVRPPEIKTSFTDKKGNKEILGKSKVTLVDKVSYKDLIVGKEYKLSLTVMDKATNKPLLENGKPVTVDHKFIAQQSNGIEEVEITLDLSHFNTKEIVAFEKLIYEGKEIAVHEDINDMGQTIKIREPKNPPTPKPKTQDSLVESIVYLIGGLSLISLASILVIAKLNKNKDNKKDDEK